MTVIAVGAHKGGTGKTTTSVLLAALLARRGPTVLIDADRQGSASTWWRLAERHQDWPASLTLEPWRDPMTLPPMAMANAVIDTGPGDPERCRAAMRLADTVVVPIGARGG